MARFPFRGQQNVSQWILSLRIIPPIVTIIPMFLMMRAIHLNGTLLSIIILHTFMNLPLVVWLLIGFYADVPKEIEEAAHVDGLGHLDPSSGSSCRWPCPASPRPRCSPSSSPGTSSSSPTSSPVNTRIATVALTEFVTPVGTSGPASWRPALWSQYRSGWRPGGTEVPVRGLTLGAAK